MSMYWEWTLQFFSQRVVTDEQVYYSHPQWALLYSQFGMSHCLPILANNLIWNVNLMPDPRLVIVIQLYTFMGYTGCIRNETIPYYGHVFCASCFHITIRLYMMITCFQCVKFIKLDYQVKDSSKIFSRLTGGKYPPIQIDCLGEHIFRLWRIERNQMTPFE